MQYDKNMTRLFAKAYSIQLFVRRPCSGMVALRHHRV